MSILKLANFLIFCLASLSCNISSQNQPNRYEFYSNIIKNLPVLPPPSVNIIQNDSLLENYRDSLELKKKVIYVNKNFIQPQIDIENLDYPDQREIYKSLIDRLNNIEDGTLDINKIKRQKNLIIRGIDTVPPLEFDPNLTKWYIRFSDIVISNDGKFGVFYSTAHTSKLSGSYRLYFLKLHNNKWSIIKTNLLEIS